MTDGMGYGTVPDCKRGKRCAMRFSERKVDRQICLVRGLDYATKP